MRFGHLRGIMASVIVGLVALLVLSGIPGLSAAYTPKTGTRQLENFLKVGGQDEMKTRNLLPSIANDVWTSDVHYRAYGFPLLSNPKLDQPMAYIGKGTDFDENGMFSPATEYDKWAERAGATSKLEITIYYDFNGIRWHDGVQMTPWDLFFSYHVNALNPRFNTDLRVLYTAVDAQNKPIYEPNRQLGIALTTKNWEGEGTMAGNPNLRVAVKYTLNGPFALFYESTLFPVLMPMHIWSKTGGGRHADFGCSVWIPDTEAAARGIPACGTTDQTKWGKGIANTDPASYKYPTAEGWVPTDADVIGHGAFKFKTWRSGVEAQVIRNEDYFTGVDQATGQVIDANLVKVLKKPTIDGIRYLVYKTTQLGVFALSSSEVDFYHWNVNAEFVPDLLKNPSIAVEANAEPGFFYMAYNFRREPWGYRGGMLNDDMGYWFRQAVSHLIDKKSIVQNLLQNFGVIGHGTVSPANTFWYNGNIPKPDYDLALANAILDDPLKGGRVPIGPDPPGACSKDTPTGCRSLPRIGTGVFEILTPQADYDPVRAAAGALIAAAMRQVGLNAVSKPTAFGEIVNRITIHDFDLFILGWRIGGTDPDYLFSFFHSSNAPAGQNYPGFNNATFDATIDASRAELDRTLRRGYIFDAQRLLAEARPYDVLYFRTNIEGYRQDRYVNWTVTAGTIWGFWSLAGIRPPSTKALRQSITTESAVASGGTAPVTVTVFDDKGTALSGATVDLSVNLGALDRTSGTTNVNGRVTATFTAPTLLPTDLFATVILQATASHLPDFPDTVSRNAQLTVFPPGAPFLSIRADLPQGDLATSGGSLLLTFTVRDQDGAVVSDADFQITVQPSGAGLTPSPDHGTGLTQVTLRAGTVTSTQKFIVTVTATKGTAPNQIRADRATDVTVKLAAGATKLCPDGSRVPVAQACRQVSTPALDVLPILAGIGVAALVAGVVAERKRRS